MPAARLLARTLAFLVLVTQALCACSFDASVPASTAVSCERDEDCPPGRSCRTDTNRCVEGREDLVAPSFVGTPTVSPRAAKLGAAVQLDFTASEPVSSVQVELAAQLRTRVLGLDGGHADGNAFTYTFIAASDDGEGAASLLVTMQDVAGNISRGVQAGVVTLDFTPPTVAPEQVTLRPARARPGDVVALQVTASEPLGPGAKLVALSSAGRLEQPPALQAGASLSFSLDTTGLSDGLVLMLQLEGLTDLAGNVADPIAVGSVTLDGTPPTLFGLTVLKAVVARESVHFSFDSDGDRVTAQVGGAPATCTASAQHFECTFDPAATQSEGLTPILVQAIDAVGNAAEARDSVTFDFTPPALVPGSSSTLLLPAAGNPLVQPTAAGPGTRVRLNFLLSELTGSVPVVSAAPLTFALLSQQGASWVFEATVPSGLSVQQPVAPVVQATDQAGNSASLTLQLVPELLLDTVAPAPLSQAPGALLLRRWPYGANETGGAAQLSLSGADGVAEGVGVVRVFAFGNPLTGELARLPTTAAGGLPESVVAGFDVADPWVEFIDAAGNRSPAAPVREQEWVVTAGGAGATNPHVASLQNLEGPFLNSSYARAPASSLVKADDAGVSIEGQGRWVYADQRGAYTPSNSSALVSDSVHGLLLARGAAALGLGTSVSQSVWDTERWWSAPAQDPELDGEPRYDAVLVDRPGVGVWAFISNSAAWSWTGASWVSVPLSDPEGDGPFIGDATITRAVWDPRSKSVLAFGALPLSGSSNGVFTVYRFTGSSWALVPTSDLEGDGEPQQIQQGLVASSMSQNAVYVFSGISVWQFTGASYKRLGGSLLSPSIGYDQLVYDEVRGELLLFTGGLQLYRYVSGAWQLVTPADPEHDGNPTLPLHLVWSPTEEQVVGLAQEQTWAWTGSSWALRHRAYTTQDQRLINPGSGRFFPLAYANPTTGFIEVAGGDEYGGAPMPDAVEWRAPGFAAIDGGRPFLPFDFYQGHVAFSPAGAGLVVNAGATWLFNGSGWTRAQASRDAGTSSQVVWNDRRSAFYMLEGHNGLNEGLEWNGSNWTLLESSSPDAGLVPNPVPYGLTRDPARSQLVLVSNGLWVRDTSWHQLPSVDPEGDGEPGGGCAYTDTNLSRVVLLNTRAWEFTGQSFRRLPHARATPDSDWSYFYGCFAAFNPLTGRSLASAFGADIYEYDSAWTARPALTLDVALSASGFPPGTSLLKLDINARAGATSKSGSGAMLTARREGRTVTLAQGNNSEAAPGWLNYSTVDPIELSRLAPRLDGQLHLSVRPTGTNGTAPARVFVDYLEVRFRVRKP